MPMEPTATAELIGEVSRRSLTAAPDAIIVTDADGRIVVCNPKAEALFGYAPDELCGELVETLLPEAYRPAHFVHRASHVRDPRTRNMGSGLDLSAQTKTGAPFSVEISLSPMQVENQTFVIAIVRDITERRRLSEALMTARQELALLHERERIARDLHDTVIHRLFAAGLVLQGANLYTTSDQAAERIQLALNEIDATIDELRTTAFALHTRTQ